MKKNNNVLSFLKSCNLFFSNLLYLCKNDIRNEGITRDNIHYYLDNLKYEIEEDLCKLKRPKVANVKDTIDKIIKDKVSIARFGDGEFELIFNRSIPFQKRDVKLSKRLQEILVSDNMNIIIGIPRFYWHSIDYCNTAIKDFTRRSISYSRKEYELALNFDIQYYSTEITQMFITLQNKHLMPNYFDEVKTIWQNREVTIIQGENITDDFEYNIFDNAKSINYIFAPSKNAFFEYDKIVASAKNIDKGRLVLIILGPTATVLAYDLAMAGYQALDIGHIAKDYNYYKCGFESNLENLTNFFSPD